jgi:hypothetical protein
MTRQAAAFRQNQLAHAVLTNDPQELLVAIDAHANLNGPFAITSEQLVALAKISSRLDHYFREETKATPLIVAAALGETELCSALVERGAERFRASAWGWVPAQYAARCGFPELARTLISVSYPVQRWVAISGGKNLYWKTRLRYPTWTISSYG